MEPSEVQSSRSPVEEDAEVHWHRPLETTQAIRRRAHEIYQQRMLAASPGDAASDWFAAEADVDAHAEHVEPDPAAPDWN